MTTATTDSWLDVLAERDLTGGDRGIQTEGDVRVSETADGVDLNTVWRSQREALDVWNSHRLAIASLLSYPTTVTGDAVPQNITSESFEESSEFGVAKGIGQDAPMLMGYMIRDYDLRLATTWRYLRNATADQIENQFVRGLEGDAKLVSGLILQRLLSPAPDVNEHGHTCYGLWTGTDGLKPPDYLGHSFPLNTSHYWVSGNAVLDSEDVEDAIGVLHQKGYGRSVGSQILVLANPAESVLIQSWRAGQETGTTGGPKAVHSFIPSSNAPAYLTPDNIVGAVAPPELNGLPVAGSYGPAWLIESDWIPASYVIVVASAGANSPDNVVAFREHPNERYRGLRQLPGNWSNYPLQDSMLTRTCGVGTRHRGAAVAIQTKASGTYDTPSIPK